jgi:FMN-dependent NADH-azoreductase
MKLLHIDSSITGANSASRQLSAASVAALKAAIPGLEVIRRDLDANPIPHLDSKRLPTVRPANAPEGAVGIADEGGSDALDEFLSADILVIGAPMYNFGIPSQLKAWIDRIAIAGKTFSYTTDGPIGLAGAKRVIVASSRGGLYAPGMPFEANDFQEKYLRAIFAFLGIGDIEIIRRRACAQPRASGSGTKDCPCDHSHQHRRGKGPSRGMTDTAERPLRDNLCPTISANCLTATFKKSSRG